MPSSNKSAKGATGHLLNVRNDGSLVFRVYGPDKEFVDYDLRFDDLLIQVLDRRGALTADETGTYLHTPGPTGYPEARG